MVSKINYLMDYLNKPMNRDSMTMLYMANNLKHERCELYRDFTLSLMYIIFDTYMGDDITSVDERKNHFNWCWGKNLKNFEKEGIRIHSTRLQNYFYVFLKDSFYGVTKKEGADYTSDNIIRLWTYILDLQNAKSKADVDTLLEVYKLFETALFSKEKQV